MNWLIKPVPKPRMTQADRWKLRPCVVRYREYADKLRELAERDEYVLGDTLTITFVMPMAKSWSNKKKKAMQHQAHQQRPDIDNLAKAFMDALAKDDSHVHTLIANKVWGYEGMVIHGNNN